MTGILIFLGVLIIGGAAVWVAAFKFGKLSVTTEIQENDLEAAKRIAEGGADLPKSRDDLADSVRDGKW